MYIFTYNYFWSGIVWFHTYIREFYIQNIIKTFDRTFKIISYNIVESDYSLVMVRFCICIWDENIVKCKCLISYIHNRRWKLKCIYIGITWKFNCCHLILFLCLWIQYFRMCQLNCFCQIPYVHRIISKKYIFDIHYV